MKTIIFTIICIIALLWVGDLTITFKPFFISLPGWHKALGIILFVFAMAVYNIGEYAKGYKHGFDDGAKECIMLVEQIIESKKQIGEDFTRDERVLNKLKRNEQ